MAQVRDGDRWVTMQFTWTDNGTPRTTLIQLNAHDVASPFADRTLTVAQILNDAISAKPGFTLTQAESVTEVTDNLLD